MNGGNGDSDRPEGGSPPLRMPVPGARPDEPEPAQRRTVAVDAALVPDEESAEKQPAPPLLPPTASGRTHKTKQVLETPSLSWVLGALAATAVAIVAIFIFINFPKYEPDSAPERQVEGVAQQPAQATGTPYNGAAPGGAVIETPAQTTVPATEQPAPAQTAPTTGESTAASATATAPAPATAPVAAPVPTPTTHTNCLFVSGERPMVKEKYILRCDEGPFLARAEYMTGGVFIYSDFEPAPQ